LKFSKNEYYYKGYLYEDPYDPRYVQPGFGDPLSGYTFRYGGNYTGRYNRYSFSNVIQWQLNSQVSKKHKLGVGAEARYHRIYSHNMDIHDPDENDSVFVISYRTLGSEDNQEYLKKPVEISAYVQDKMEYDIMIINAGVRFDYFDPRSSLPSNLKNPQNNKDFPGAFIYTKASKKTQLSPRLGVSFPITDQGIIHFSYGHFFQIPSFEDLYVNSDYLVTEGSGLSNYTGNPDLDAQRTVMYEIGLQQVLFTNFKIDVSAYYRDIRNLLGMEIINTYQGTKYARYINRDYGNVRGFIVSLEKRFADYFGAKLDYTYQIAEGNASDPMSVYNNNQSNPPVESNKTVVPLNWDQRHTLNLSVNVGVPGDWTAGLIFSYGSGLPYTESIRVSKGVQFENGGRKPATYNVDLRADKAFEIGPLHLSAFILVYNLLDIKNEYSVNNASGRANVDMFTGEAGTIFGLNTIQQYVNNPSSFSAPRQVRLGVSLGLY
jgi:outer membrane receptor protein involved in Fe transport